MKAFFVARDLVTGEQEDLNKSDTYTQITSAMSSYYKLTAGSFEVAKASVKDPNIFSTTADIVNGPDKAEILELLKPLKEQEKLYRGSGANGFLQCTLFPHLKQNGEVDQQLGERLEALWNKDLVGLDPTDPDECNIEEYYQKMIGGLATVGNVYQKKAENLAGSVLTIENNRQQVIGVSSDEELQNMIKFQNAYNLASKMISTMAEMYDQLILNTAV